MATHAETCPCSFCQSLAAKTMTTDRWRELHAGHGPALVVPYTPHPSGEWVVLRCPCGAGHVTTHAPVQ